MTMQIVHMRVQTVHIQFQILRMRMQILHMHMQTDVALRAQVHMAMLMPMDAQTQLNMPTHLLK